MNWSKRGRRTGASANLPRGIRGEASRGPVRKRFQALGVRSLASLALHDKRARDEPFVESLPLIERAAADERNFVKKGVSWALRGIGHRNILLHAEAVALAQRLAKSPEAAARWVGKEAIRDLTRPAVVQRLKK